MTIPVIAIDGTVASGKGTVASRVADALGWHLLDSGALYRLVAWQALENGVALDDAQALSALAAELPVQFLANGQILLRGKDVTEAIRFEACSQAASVVAAIAPVRSALVARQRAMQMAPGLVADGRDMGSVIFPDAPLKVFLTASVAERAKRRFKQLIEKGYCGTLSGLEQEIAARDARDMGRSEAPLKIVPDALVIDSTECSIETVVDQILTVWKKLNQER